MEHESATELLKSDHRVIERVLGSVEGIAKSVAGGGEVPVDRLRKAVVFSQTFVDRCHHGKEETCLFPCLERKGIPKDGGPIGVMLYEHQVGRELSGRIQAALSGYEEGRVDGKELGSVCLEYVVHLRQHIFKEENMLFRMGQRVMDNDDQEGTLACFERTEEERVGEEKHEEMLGLAEELASEAAG